MAIKLIANFLDDADLSVALPALALSTMPFAGQICFAQTRILTPRTRYDDTVRGDPSLRPRQPVHIALDEIMAGTTLDIEAIAQREAITLRSARMPLSLAFVAPDIIGAAADGILPRGFGLSRLLDLPSSWADQRATLGVPARS